MAWWVWVLDSLGILLALLLLYGIALIIRRRHLARHGGTFELSHRLRSTHPGRGWVLGLGRYRGERLEWYRVFSLSPRPKRSWDRADLEYAGRRQPEGAETMSLYADHIVVRCLNLDGEAEFAMSPASLTGFQAWLEAMPPGSRSVRPGDSPNAL